MTTMTLGAVSFRSKHRSLNYLVDLIYHAISVGRLTKDTEVFVRLMPTLFVRTGTCGLRR
jgi:hypothetical protein